MTTTDPVGGAAGHRERLLFCILLCAFLWSIPISIFAADAGGPPELARTPPMGWNDWAHYQCNYTAKTILANARALVKTGLAARGYNTVTIDDCWMKKTRNAKGELQADPERFPRGMKPAVQAIHSLGLKFGIYEDAGYETCAKLAGSGEPKGGGKDHFMEDARLFASWGVDYLKLDGCNVYVASGGSNEAAFRRAYAAENAALKASGRAIIFSESAPAYFQGTPEWYDVLGWVGVYGQLWREGTDIQTFDAKTPDTPRFQSVLWNYAYNLPLGRFQKPGNWNDADFIIGGDRGMSLAETRSQLALWSMMSAPLILSSDLEKLSPRAIAILGDKDVIAIDQDGLGRMATLVRRGASEDILLKPLAGGDYAVAVLNRDSASAKIGLRAEELGFAASKECRLTARNLWSGEKSTGVRTLHATIAPHDTAIWRIQASPACGTPGRTGTITMTAVGGRQNIAGYARCLSGSGRVEDCAGTPLEVWTVTGGRLRSGGHCLSVVAGRPTMRPCSQANAEHWNYTTAGNLISAVDGKCLTADGAEGLDLQTCGHNQPRQIWSLPN